MALVSGPDFVPGHLYREEDQLQEHYQGQN